MIYNRELEKEKKSTDCITCRYFNKKTKKCEGLGSICFETDSVGNLIDPRTGLKIKKEGIN